MPVFHLLLVDPEMLTLRILLLIIWWRASMTWGWKKSQDEDTSCLGAATTRDVKFFWQLFQDFYFFLLLRTRHWRDVGNLNKQRVWQRRPKCRIEQLSTLSSRVLTPLHLLPVMTSCREVNNHSKLCSRCIAVCNPAPWLADSTARARSRVSRKQPGVELDTARVTLSDSLSTLQVKSPVNLRLGLMSVCVFIKYPWP